MVGLGGRCCFSPPQTKSFKQGEAAAAPAPSPDQPPAPGSKADKQEHASVAGKAAPPCPQAELQAEQIGAYQPPEEVPAEELAQTAAWAASTAMPTVGVECGELASSGPGSSDNSYRQEAAGAGVPGTMPVSEALAGTGAASMLPAAPAAAGSTHVQQQDSLADAVLDLLPMAGTAQPAIARTSSADALPPKTEAGGKAQQQSRLADQVLGLLSSTVQPPSPLDPLGSAAPSSGTGSNCGGQLQGSLLDEVLALLPPDACIPLPALNASSKGPMQPLEAQAELALAELWLPAAGASAILKSVLKTSPPASQGTSTPPTARPVDDDPGAGHAAAGPPAAHSQRESSRGSEAEPTVPPRAQAIAAGEPGTTCPPDSLLLASVHALLLSAGPEQQLDAAAAAGRFNDPAAGPVSAAGAAAKEDAIEAGNNAGSPSCQQSIVPGSTADLEVVLAELLRGDAPSSGPALPAAVPGVQHAAAMPAALEGPAAVKALLPAGVPGACMQAAGRLPANKAALHIRTDGTIPSSGSISSSCSSSTASWEGCSMTAPAQAQQLPGALPCAHPGRPVSRSARPGNATTAIEPAPASQTQCLAAFAAAHGQASSHPSWGTSSGGPCEEGSPLAAMYARQVRQRQEAEKRYVALRQQWEEEGLAGCTFKPALEAGKGRGPSRPGSAPTGGRSGGTSRGGPEGVYERQFALRLREVQRQELVRQQQEREQLAACTFSPAVDPRSKALFDSGVRYGCGPLMAGGGAATCSAAQAASMDAAVWQQLRVLHSAGLRASTAAAVLSRSVSRVGCSSGDLACGIAGTSGCHTGAPPQPGAQDEQGCSASFVTAKELDSGAAATAPPAQLAGSALPAALDSAPLALQRQQSAPAQVTPGCERLVASPVKASDRLYAHARDLQRRQRDAQNEQAHLLQQEALAASPRVRPFPRTIYSSAPSPPLSRRSPPPSRPVSALAPGGAASAAAAQLAAGMGGQEGRSAAYWRRFGLGAEPDFAGFLERQHKFARHAEERLEREREASGAPAHPPAGMSPGSQRILQRRQAAAAVPTDLAEGQPHPLGRAAHAEAGRAASAEGHAAPSGTAPGRQLRPCSARAAVASTISRGLAGIMSLAGLPCDVAGSDAAADDSSSDAGTTVVHSVEGLAAAGGPEVACASSRPASPARTAGSQREAPVPDHCTFQPAITGRASARPARSPEQMHAEWAARQQRLELQRRLAEEAAVAACTFAPDIAPLPGPSSKYASAQPKLSKRGLDAYMEEVRRRSAARQEAAADGARAREDKELAECTFQPRLSPRARPPRAGCATSKPTASSPAAAGPGNTSATGDSPAKQSDVLSQVQALLAGRGQAAPAVAQGQAKPGAEPPSSPRCLAGKGCKQAAQPAAQVAGAVTAQVCHTVPRVGSASAPGGSAEAVPAATGESGSGSFDAYLAQAARGLERLQVAD